MEPGYQVIRICPVPESEPLRQGDPGEAPFSRTSVEGRDRVRARYAATGGCRGCVIRLVPAAARPDEKSIQDVARVEAES